MDHDDQRRDLHEGEEGLQRREFLERAAYTAGLAGAASLLPVDVLLGEQRRRRPRRCRVRETCRSITSWS